MMTDGVTGPGPVAGLLGATVRDRSRALGRQAGPIVLLLIGVAITGRVAAHELGGLSRAVVGVLGAAVIWQGARALYWDPALRLILGLHPSSRGLLVAVTLRSLAWATIAALFATALGGSPPTRVWGLMLLAATLATPAALVGGALLASPRARRWLAFLTMLATGADTARPPPLFWFHLPGSVCGGTVLASSLLLPDAPLLVAAACGLTIWGLTVLLLAPATVRAVIHARALDHDVLATLPISGGAGRAATWARVLGLDERAAAVFARNDLSMHRRHPLWFVASFVLDAIAVGSLFLSEGPGVAKAIAWASAGLLGLGLAAQVSSPVEHPRLRRMFGRGPSATLGALGFASRLTWGALAIPLAVLVLRTGAPLWLLSFGVASVVQIVLFRRLRWRRAATEGDQPPSEG